MLDVLAKTTWALAELPPCGVDEFAGAGFARIAEAIDCREGIVVFAARVGPREGDPLLGFRVLRIWSIGSANSMSTRTADVVRADAEILRNDPDTQRLAREAGRHRVYHQPDPRRSAESVDSINARLWDEFDLCDQLKSAHALDDDHELHFGFQRLSGDHPFTPADIATVEALMHGIRTWARRLGFLFGGLGPGPQLSPRESEMLVLLLGSAAQKEHPSHLGVSGARARELVRAVHSKLGTSTRAELHSRWMSERVVAADVPPVLGRKW